MVLKKIKWKRKTPTLHGTMEGERRFKAWVLVETPDLDNEVTLVDSIKAKMDWFIQEHGGPMIDSHSNAVVGHWESWGVDTHPDTKTAGLWVEGVVHQGPDGSPFPAADEFWNAVKDGRVKGLSWGGNKLEGHFNYDTSTGQMESNFIEELLPYEISGVRSDIKGPSGKPLTPALDKANLIQISKEVKTGEEPELSEKEWLENCKKTMSFVGPDAEKVAKALYENDMHTLKNMLGSYGKEAMVNNKSQSHEVTHMEESEKKEFNEMKSQVQSLMGELKAQKDAATKEAEQKALSEKISTEVKAQVTPIMDELKSIKDALQPSEEKKDASKEAEEKTSEEKKSKKEGEEEEEENSEEDEQKNTKDDLKQKVDAMLEKERKALYDSLEITETPDPNQGGTPPAEKKTFDAKKYKKERSS